MHSVYNATLSAFWSNCIVCVCPCDTVECTVMRIIRIRSFAVEQDVILLRPTAHPIKFSGDTEFPKKEKNMKVHSFDRIHLVARGATNICTCEMPKRKRNKPNRMLVTLELSMPTIQFARNYIFQLLELASHKCVTWRQWWWWRRGTLVAFAIRDIVAT